MVIIGLLTNLLIEKIGIDIGLIRIIRANVLIQALVFIGMKSLMIMVHITGIIILDLMIITVSSPGIFILIIIAEMASVIIIIIMVGPLAIIFLLLVTTANLLDRTFQNLFKTGIHTFGNRSLNQWI